MSFFFIMKVFFFLIKKLCFCVWFYIFSVIILVLMAVCRIDVVTFKTDAMKWCWKQIKVVARKDKIGQHVVS